VSQLDSTAIVYTPQIIASSLISDITSQQSQQASLEEQLGTGDLVNRPSDNPAAAAQLLSLNGSLARAQQYQTNTQDGLGWLALGTSTANQIVAALQQAQQTVTSLSGNSLAGNGSALAGAAAQIGSVRQQLIGLANTTYNGQAIFAGTGSVTAAYDQNGNYVGGGNPPTRTVASGTTVPVSVTGPSLFGTAPNDLLSPTGILATLQSDISTGTSASISKAETTDLQSLDTALSQVEAQAAVMGSNYQRMSGFSQQATDATTALQQQISSLDSVNVAQTTTQLAASQQAFQSALWATAQIQQDNLVQFLQ
jgi:flagellar hook-associated protein 3 FlgL